MHRRRELGIGNTLDDELPLPSEKLSWSDLRTNRLLDSGLSGAVTGGLLRGLKSMLHLTCWFFYIIANYVLYKQVGVLLYPVRSQLALYASCFNMRATS